MTASYTVPAIAPKAAGETDAQYRARLASFDNKKLTFTGSVTWTDANANAYGAISAQSETTERLPVLSISASAVATSALPGDAVTTTFTIQNVGTIATQSGQLVITLPDATTVPFTVPALAPGASTTFNGNYTVPAIAPKASGETDAQYRARLATFDNKKLTFEVDLAPRLPRAVHTDAKRLQQILKNLLSNAFKFTERGRVTLEVNAVTEGWSSDNETLNRARSVIAFSAQNQ